MERDERTSFVEPAGVMAMACRHRRPDATRETPNGDRGRDQPATRESGLGRVGWRRGSYYQRDRVMPVEGRGLS